MKRILIDGRFVGVGESQTRYVLELIRNILKLDKENEYTLLIRPQGIKDSCQWLNIPEKEKKSFIENWKLKTGNLTLVVMDIQHYSPAEQTKLLKYLNEEKFDLVHFTQFNHPIFYKGRHVTTIQDLTMQGHLHRQKFYRRLAFKLVMKTAAFKSDKVIAISKNTRDEVIDYYHVPKDKFTLVYHGLDRSRFSPELKHKKTEIENFKKKYGIKGDYLLYTGMWKRHKNVLRMMKSYELYLEKNDFAANQLVIVGKIDGKEPEVIAEIKRINAKFEKEKGNKVIITTGFIEENELPIAYAAAKAYVIPSLSEGFGWPPLEAMCCATPVIASTESCIPEILGDAPIYFDPYDIEDMAKKIKKIMTLNEEETKKIVEKGIAQTLKYNWSDAAKKTLEVYKEVLGE